MGCVWNSDIHVCSFWILYTRSWLVITICQVGGLSNYLDFQLFEMLNKSEIKLVKLEGRPSKKFLLLLLLLLLLLFPLLLLLLLFLLLLLPLPMSYRVRSSKQVIATDDNDLLLQDMRKINSENRENGKDVEITDEGRIHRSSFDMHTSIYSELVN